MKKCWKRRGQMQQSMKQKKNILQMVYCWMRGKHFLLYGGNILDKYVVKLYAHAYRDLEGIYAYIEETC